MCPRRLGQAPASAPSLPLAPGRVTLEPGLFPRAGAGECLVRFLFAGGSAVWDSAGATAQRCPPAGPAGGSPGQQRRFRAGLCAVVPAQTDGPPGTSTSPPSLAVLGSAEPWHPTREAQQGGPDLPPRPLPCPQSEGASTRPAWHRLLGAGADTEPGHSAGQCPGPRAGRNTQLGSGAGFRPAG